MTGFRFSLILSLICLVCAGAGPVCASFDEPLSEEESFFEEAISIEFKNKRGQEIGYDIRDDVRRGQEFLKQRVAGSVVVREEKRITVSDRKGRKREKVVTAKALKPNFLLAVEDVAERKLRPVLITSTGCATNGFEVKKSHGTGVGSRFEVTYPENMAVLALRTTVRSGPNSFKEVVYTPYSPSIDTPQVRKAGLDYLVQQIETARQELKAKNVGLTGFDGLFADTMATDVSLVLSIIEHIDPVRFKNCPQGEEGGLVHEVLTIVGANTTEAYAYSKSTAGARGLFQLTPDTYRRLREKYPRAGLNKDFISGSLDHGNAAKASMLLFDSDLADLPRERMADMRQNLRAIGMYVAAAYNCGAGRVQKSARACGDNWTCRLPEETKLYLKKFDVVWDLRNALDK